jgi:hypothetical protein
MVSATISHFEEHFPTHQLQSITKKCCKSLKQGQTNTMNIFISTQTINIKSWKLVITFEETITMKKLNEKF